MNTNITNGNITPAITQNNGPITVRQDPNTAPQSYPNVIPNNIKITSSQHTDNGEITARLNPNITLTPFDLANIKDTMQGMTTALDDVQTLMHLIHYGNLSPKAIQSIARATQSHVNAWADVGNDELDTLDGIITAYNGKVTVRGQV